ncbi:MAG: hypothetical protein RIR18_1417 [Pseudomonadota bacterium]|jgi:hypothetical protein
MVFLVSLKMLTRKVLLAGFVATVSLASLPASADRQQKFDPEAQLLNIYRLMAEGQAEPALNAADVLVERFPTFNLGHLVRADLLQSRVRPITTLGDAHKPEQFSERLNDLREEAKGRFQALISPVPDKMLPDVLLKLSPEQKHLLVVDASKSRLYVFSHQDGELKYLTDYYVSIGKAGSDKVSTGDQKTPLGVYRITGSIPGNKLTDFYGKGALTLNYPNSWDQQRGRTGYGIWLHGVPSNSYNRAPKASNGCVVLANPDMETLMEKIQPGTHVVISDKIKWLTPAVWKTEQERFLRAFTGNQALETASIFRYPASQQMVQISSRGKDTPKDQYWSFDGVAWRPAQKSG